MIMIIVIVIPWSARKAVAADERLGGAARAAEFEATYDSMLYRRRKLFCTYSALHAPCIPVSMLALDFAAGGLMNIHLEDGVSERTQH